MYNMLKTMKQFITSARMSKKSIISKYTHMHAPQKVHLISNKKEEGEIYIFSGNPCLYFGSEVTISQLCLALCDPMDCIVHGILQARILEWVVFPFSRGSSQPRDQTQVSLIVGRFFTS